MKTVILMLMFLFVPSFSNAYIDLDSNHIFYKDIIELKEKDVALGYPDNTFRADSYITEEELITILFRASNLDACKNFSNWPYDYIELGINNGIVVDDSLVTPNELIEFVEKIRMLPIIKNSDSYFINLLKRNSCTLGGIEGNTENLTRAEVCSYINKLIESDDKVTTKELPQEVQVYYSNNQELDITTIIKSIEVFDYDSYEGKYSEVINQIKIGEHPYLKGRNKNATGNYIIAVEFNTVNNNEYGVWTSYKSLKFEDIEVKDAFDTDEINYQLLNCAYDAILIKPNENYITTAFYVVDNKPEELVINRDITTLYDLRTHKYVDVYSFGKINVEL